MKRFIFFLGFILIPVFAFLQELPKHYHNCYTILAGKDATENGAVVMAHNEDDHGENLVNWFKVPGKKHKGDEFITLKNGAKVPQVETTYGYIWLEMPGQQFADSYLNEHGVAIASNACPSREDNPDLTDGGIGYWLRRLMAQRAKTAKEAVRIGGELVEKYGYASSGRTYSVADAKGAWVMSVVNGKHWVAQRVPDDEVMIIPNYYTITTVDLEDKENYLASDDLIEYAIERNWYNPDKEDEFNFRKAYGHPRTLASMGNIARKWEGLELITEQEYPMDEPFPFTVKPKEPLMLQDFMRVLENHYEGSELDESQNYKHGNPHLGTNAICSRINQYGFVTQLRENMPVEIGTVMWLALRRPCVQPFIPWYLGMSEMPENFALTDPESALENHFDPPEKILQKSEGHAFVEYVKYSGKIDDDYGTLINGVKEYKRDMERELLRKSKDFEERVLQIYSRDKKRAHNMLKDFTLKYLDETREKMKELLDKSEIQPSEKSVME
jgi:dipeptidase